ncbi:uncharacterized protein L201_002036 [Kwoniella dendrophila CBS 6074]|uniref:Uncharacterized protein n=1 Tax=Kwoniella dendrophila CBS 6074 TaxID=1295534 RepID=A0AAX4JRH1_9TREE
MAFLGSAIIVLGGLSVDSRVLPRGNVGSQGSPLLLGPNGNNGGGGTAASAVTNKSSTQNNDNNNSSDNDDDEDTSTTSTTSTSVSSTSTSNSSTSTLFTITESTKTTTSSSAGTSSSSTPTTSSSTASAESQIHENANRLPSDPPKQPSSIRYLVPVFLLIVITLAGFGYQKYRKRKKRRSRSSMAGKDFENLMKNGNDPFINDPCVKNENNNNRGWKQIPLDEDEKNDYDEDVWNSKMDNYGYDNDVPQLRWEQGLNDSYNNTNNSGLIRSGQFVSAGQKGWGWKESWNNFKSARGKNDYGLDKLEQGYDLQQEEQEEQVEEEKTTMKLVKSGLTSEATVTNLSKLTSINEHQYQGIAIDEDDNMQNTRSADKQRLKSKLERNKSPNKRSSQSTSPPFRTNQDMVANQQQIIPEAPEWIRPRSVSPTNMNILSPPMQPHLFFQPTPPTQSNKKMIEPSMISEYSELDDNATMFTISQGNTPIIPSLSPSLVPAMETSEKNQKKMKMPRIPSTASALAGIDSFSVVSSNKANISNKQDKPISGKKGGYKSSGLSSVPESSKPLKRSTAIQNLSITSPSTLSPPHANGKMLKKNRVEKKQLKANNQVEDILKASWSGRALITSPPLNGDENDSQSNTLSSQNNKEFANKVNNKIVPGMMSPGLDQLSNTNGIEQRLALLKNVQI